MRRPKGLARVRSNEVTTDELLRFAGVGVVSTLGYLFLFVAWQPLVGAYAANARRHGDRDAVQHHGPP